MNNRQIKIIIAIVLVIFSYIFLLAYSKYIDEPIRQETKYYLCPNGETEKIEKNRSIYCNGSIVENTFNPINHYINQQIKEELNG